MEVKSIGTLNTVRLKLSPFLPRPLAMLYFEHPVLKTVCLSQHWFGGGGGRAIRGIQTIAKVDIMLHIHI